jgi:hypothetical protein
VALTISSVPDVLARIRSARDVSVGTYFLQRGALTDALADAARHGAHVSVSAQADPYGGARGDTRPQQNVAIAAELRKAGASVTLFESAQKRFHLKAAVCDGVTYLDDRNWTASGRDLVVADDDPCDAAHVREALAGEGADRGAVATDKATALQREADLLARSPKTAAVVETEHIGAGVLSHALREHAALGAPTTLIVARAKRGAKETKLIAGLRRDGVKVLEHGSNEKLALAGATAWIGSANATSSYWPDQHGRPHPAGDELEWGVVTRSPQLVDAVRAALARDAAA